MAAVDEYQQRTRQSVFVEYVMLGPGERCDRGNAGTPPRPASQAGHPAAALRNTREHLPAHILLHPKAPPHPSFLPRTCPADVNCTPEHAHQLGALLKGRDVLVNLIPWNPILSPSIRQVGCIKNGQDNGLEYCLAGPSCRLPSGKAARVVRSLTSAAAVLLGAETQQACVLGLPACRAHNL